MLVGKERRSVPPMSATQDIDSLSRNELIELVKQLVAQNAQLREIITKQQEEIDQLKRSGKRQAAPFSKGTRKQNPKRPGRKPGQGSFRHKAPPIPDKVTEPPVDVPVTVSACPACGGALESERVDVAYRTEIPDIPKPIVTEYRVEVCRCTQCGKQVRGQHPEVAADQYGATAHRFGDRLMAWAHTLHYEIGVPVRKVPKILKEGHGVEITQSAITQDASRRARGEVGAEYHQLRAQVKESASVYTDDTSWRVNGARAQLMGFETDRLSVYQIRARHRNEEVREVIPADYDGTMVTDRGRSYDAQEFNAVKQQKCLGHVQKSISEVIEKKVGKARWFGRALKAMLKRATELWSEHRAGRIDAKKYAREGAKIQREVTAHLRVRTLTDEDNARLLRELGRHNDRGNLLRFLKDPAIEPFNFRAERGLRGPIISRKVSHCSKTWDGAETYAAFVSVIRTRIKQGAKSAVDGLCALFRSSRSRASPA